MATWKYANVFALQHHLLGSRARIFGEFSLQGSGFLWPLLELSFTAFWIYPLQSHREWESL